ncbi:protein phosphatase 1 regulatory subunit 3C-B-like [Menidia menidia]
MQLQLSEAGGVTTGRHPPESPVTTNINNHSHPPESPGPWGSGSSLVLNFSPPGSDYLELRNRLRAQQVCLETCAVQGGLLSGTVQVRNLCFEKCVWVRVSSDCWGSFRDVPCSYLNNVYGRPDVDTFSFLVPVPVESSRRVQFCIQFQTSDQTFWDNNLGNNYELLVLDQNHSLVPGGGAGPGGSRGGAGPGAPGVPLRPRPQESGD